MSEYEEIILAINNLIKEIDYVQNDYKRVNKSTPITDPNIINENLIIIQKSSIEIQINPENINQYIIRGKAFNKLKLYKKALDDLNMSENLIHKKYSSSEPENKIGELINSLNNIFVDNYFYDIYLERGISYHGLGKYNTAVDNFTNALGKKTTTGGQTTACAYSNRANSYLQLGEYNLAINDFSNAIEICPLLYYNYLFRGIVYLSINQYEKAISDFSQSLEKNPIFYLTLFYRGLANLKLRFNDLAFTDLNKYFYYCVKNNDISYLTKLIPVLQEQPYSLAMISNLLDVDNLDLLLNIYDKSISQIEDFILLITYCNCSVQNANIGNSAILLYYLKGYVKSYIIFDEVLDNESDDSQSTLTVQEYYYYTKLASELDLDFQAVWNDSIKKINSRNNLSDIDYYYLGHIYLLNNLESESVDSFAKSKGYIFSHLMLYALEKNKNPELSVIYNIINRLNKIKDKKIIKVSPLYFYNFQDFISLKECQIALEYLNDYIPDNLVELVCQKEIWESYGLSEKSRNDLRLKLQKNKGKEDLEAVYNIILPYIPTFSDPENIKRKMIDSDSRTNAILLNIESAVKNGGKLENQIGLAIHRWEFKNELLYKEIILYYYSMHQLDSESTINLLLYLLHIKLCKVRENTEEKIYTIAKEFLSLIPGYSLVRSILFVIWKTGCQYEDFYQEGAIINNHFEEFAKMLWERIEEIKGIDHMNSLKQLLK